MLTLCRFAIFVARTYIIICYVMHFDKFGLHTMAITFFYLLFLSLIMMKCRFGCLSKAFVFDTSAHKGAMWAKGRWYKMVTIVFFFSLYTFGGILWLFFLLFVVKFQCIVRFRVWGVTSWYVGDENLFCPFFFWIVPCWKLIILNYCAMLKTYIGLLFWTWC